MIETKQKHTPFSLNEDISVKVPYWALEHRANPEEFRLLNKLRAAILRWHVAGDFLAFMEAPLDRVPHVEIRDFKLDREKLEYNVLARIV